VEPTKTETLVACPVCGLQNLTNFMDLNDYSISQEPFKIVQCDNCTFLFTNPRPKSEYIGPYYESEVYISHSNSSKGLINNIYKQVRHYTIAKKVALMMRLVDGKRTILDYGCGTGEFLNVMQLNKWQARGIESSEQARKQAIDNYKLEISSPETIYNLEKGQFSIITMWHVMEHIHQLNETMAQLRSLLSEKGKMVIAVPNAESKDAQIYGKYWGGWDVPRHLYHFTQKTVEKLLEKHQLKVVDVKPMVFDSFYVSLLSEKYKTGSMNPVKAFWNGLRTNIAGVQKVNNYTSLIYIVEKM
jgi:2-polyprenyl-3-methyl-5-hydroxy-6-metoxy-1,4-benzoquinol methylase